jgi:hypothetical protein
MALRFRRNPYRLSYYTIYREDRRNYTERIFIFHFINTFFKLFASRGNLKASRKRFYYLFYIFYQDINKTSPFSVFYDVFNRGRPKTFLFSKRISGTVVKIPMRITIFKSFNISFQIVKKFAISSTKRFSTVSTIYFFLKKIIRTRRNILKRQKIVIHRLAYINYSYARRLKSF